MVDGSVPNRIYEKNYDPFYLFAVTGVIVQQPRQYGFFPVDPAWQKKAAGLFGRWRPSSCLYSSMDAPVPMVHRRPHHTVDTKGDGACGPRTFSLAVYGHQHNHQRIRDVLVAFILRGSIPGETLIRNTKFYNRMKKMKKSDTWFTSHEIDALAFLLDTPIYSCVEKKNADDSLGPFYWQRSPHQSSPYQVQNDRGIYILNANNHFQLVTKF